MKDGVKHPVFHSKGSAIYFGSRGPFTDVESVLMRWMNLEPIIQSEISQKEKDKYCILTHVYGT